MMTGVYKREFASEFSQLYNAPVKQEQSHMRFDQRLSVKRTKAHINSHPRLTGA